MKFRLLFESRKVDFRFMGLQPAYWVPDQLLVNQPYVMSPRINSVSSPLDILLCCLVTVTQSFSALLFPCFSHLLSSAFQKFPVIFFPLETRWMDSVSSYPVEYLLLWFWWFSRSSYPSTQDNSGQLVSSLPRLELRVTTAFLPLSYTACLYPDPPQPYPP